MRKRTSTFSLASAASLLPQDGPDSAPSVSARSTPSARKSSRQGSGLLPTPSVAEAMGGHISRGGKRKNELLLRGIIQSSSPTSAPSTAPDFEEQLCLPGDSPASRSLSPGSERARQMTVTSGRKCSELFTKQSPLGSLVRMLLESSIWNSTKCVLTWKAKTMKSSRLLFQLAPSTPRTEGIGSGYWEGGRILMTPKAGDAEFATPSTSDRAREKSTHLPTQIAMLPTPKKQNCTGASERGQGGKDLQTTVGTRPGLKLQPAFVEWMMGYPDGWTDLKHLEMPSSPKSHTKLSG